MAVTCSIHVTAWQQDPMGAIVDRELANRMGWRLGDRVVIQGLKIPLDLELTNYSGVLPVSFAPPCALLQLEICRNEAPARRG